MNLATNTKLHSKLELGDQEDSDGGVQNLLAPNVLAGYPRATKLKTTRVAGVVPTQATKLYE